MAKRSRTEDAIGISQPLPEVPAPTGPIKVIKLVMQDGEAISIRQTAQTKDAIEYAQAILASGSYVHTNGSKTTIHPVHHIKKIVIT